MKRGLVDMYIKFNKNNISELLPEKRPGMVFRILTCLLFSIIISGL